MSDLNDFSPDFIPNLNIEYMCNKMDPSITANGFTKLMQLCLTSSKYPENLNLIEEYITNNSDELNKKNSTGWRTIDLVISNFNSWSNLDTVKILLSKNAQFNGKRDYYLYFTTKFYTID